MKLHERYKEAKFINQADREDFIFSGGRPYGECEISETVALNDAVIDFTGGVYINKNVHFGRQVMVLSCSHPTSEKDGMKRRRMLRVGMVRIDEDAYIGSRALILEGVTIGKGAYVAAGAVVIKDVAPYTLVAGVPAREVKKL